MLMLVIELPDGSPGTIAADATDVLAFDAAAGPVVVLDTDGVRRLRALVDTLVERNGHAVSARRSSEKGSVR